MIDILTPRPATDAGTSSIFYTQGNISSSNVGRHYDGTPSRTANQLIERGL